MASHKRHKEYSDEDLKRKKVEVTPTGTLKCDAKWNRVFREYLREKEFQSTEYWCYPDNELDAILAKFWFEVRSSQQDENGEYLHYSLTSLRSLRNGLTRELVKHNHNIDQTTDPQYKKSQMAFKDASKELKKIGKGTIKSYPEIEHADITKLYNSKTLDPKGSPQSLQDKVQFDLRFYFIRRANENIDKFTKKTFAMQIDPNSGFKFIKKVVDKQTKNHQDDTAFVSGIMPEMPHSPLCPVKSYMDYCSKLHPRCEYLWQQPKEIEDFRDVDIWYKPLKVGLNPLSSFMSRVSHAAELSRVYTNHSIRVTGMTMLGRFNFSDKQIMSVSGHRSINSLSVYKKVSDQEKITMGMAMNHYLQTPPKELNVIQQRDQPRPIAPKKNKTSAALGAPLQIETANCDNFDDIQVIPKPKTQNEIIQYEPEDPLLQEKFAENFDFDVNSVLNDIEQNIAMTQIDTVSNKSTTLQCQTIKKSSPSVPIFNNCKIGSIGNIHFHIHKN